MINVTCNTEIRILKVSVTSNARIQKEALKMACENVGLSLPSKDRHENDALRMGVRKTLEGVGLLTIAGNKARLVDAPAKAPVGEMRIDLHLQKKDTVVNYGHVGAVLKGVSGGAFWITEDEEAFAALPTPVQQALEQTQGILEFGMSTYFDVDLRALASDLLEGCIKFWSGTFLAIGKDQIEKAAKVSKAFSELTEGRFQLKALTVSPDQESLKTLQEDLAEAYTTQMQELSEQLALTTTPKQARKVGDKYEALKRAARKAQEELGIKFGQEYDTLENDLLMNLMANASF